MHVWLWVHGCRSVGLGCDEMMYGMDWAGLSSGMYVSCGELIFSEAMRVWYCAVLLSEVIHVWCAQCARGHRGSGYGRDGLCRVGVWGCMCAMVRWCTRYATLLHRTLQCLSSSSTRAVAPVRPRKSST
jgi:hypothetical protein